MVDFMAREVAAATKPGLTAKIGRKLPDVKPISFDGNLQRMLEGLTCSPFILRAVIHKLLQEYENTYPDTVRQLL